jgi:hypothetical protein
MGAVPGRDACVRLDVRAVRPTGAGMDWKPQGFDQWAGGPQVAEPSRATAAYAHLRRAFERQVVWAGEFAHAGDPEAARHARRAADAICDELSAD